MSKPRLDVDPLVPELDWFNTVLEACKIDGRAAGVTAKSIGTGQIGENVRFTIDYAERGADAPDSIVGKFPSSSESSLMTAKLLGHYRREVKFYQTFDIAHEIAPRAYYTDYDEATNTFCLMMQDMAPASQGDQLAGCTLADAERAIDAAAILHAAHWNDPKLDGFDWLQGSDAAPAEPITPEMTAGLWVGFKERYGDRVTQDVMDIGDAYAAFLAKGDDRYDGPYTLTHGDYRLDNMLFGDAGAPRRLAIVDWQTPGKRGPLIDVAYFIGAGFTQADRPKYENALIERYHKGLLARGVTGYSLEEAKRHYALFSFYGMAVAFGAAMLVKQTERGDEMFLTMLRRHAAQAAANGGLDLIA